MKQEIAREKDLIERYVKEQMGSTEDVPEQLDELPELERLELLLAMKKKWEIVNSKFQRMSHHVILDTEGQVRRKEKLEKELQQLEMDIGKLERSGSIAVRKY